MGIAVEANAVAHISLMGLGNKIAYYRAKNQHQATPAITNFAFLPSPHCSH